MFSTAVNFVLVYHLRNYLVFLKTLQPKVTIRKYQIVTFLFMFIDIKPLCIFKVFFQSLFAYLLQKPSIISR